MIAARLSLILAKWAIFWKTNDAVWKMRFGTIRKHNQIVTIIIYRSRKFRINFDSRMFSTPCREAVANPDSTESSTSRASLYTHRMRRYFNLFRNWTHLFFQFFLPHFITYVHKSRMLLSMLESKLLYLWDKNHLQFHSSCKHYLIFEK